MPQHFSPRALGKDIVREAGSDPKPIVTLLIGSGFSVTAGIDTAETVIQNIKAAKYPILEDTENLSPRKPDESEYTYLMRNLGHAQQVDVIRKAVAKAYDEGAKLYNINFAHLMLAIMAKAGYINRILTVNFDPLIVEALSLVNARIRTYDVSAADSYPSDAFEPGTVVYLHGQIHSQLLCNDNVDLSKIKDHYEDILVEAIRDSYFVVCGYSGDCDPLVDVLTKVKKFPRKLWWSQFESEDKLKLGAEELFNKHPNDALLVCNLGADKFMQELVMEGMRLDFPEIIKDPAQGMIKSLEHIRAVPQEGPGTNIIQEAIEDLKAHKATCSPASPDSDPSTLDSRSLPTRLELALASTPAELLVLAGAVTPDPNDSLSQAVGNALLAFAGTLIDSKDYLGAKSLLSKVSPYGLSPNLASWLPALRGCVLSAEAQNESNLPEQRKLWEEAFASYAEATRIKPDMPEVFFDWGIALDQQARIEPDLSTKQKLWEEAYAKYAEATRIKPDMHEAFNNWGIALDEQAQVEPELRTKQRLWNDAYAKYAEATRIKPDKHEAFYNWGDALDEQAQVEPELSTQRKLWNDAYAKFAEATRIKPDDHEAFYIWGLALDQQARVEPDLSTKQELWNDAYAKYAVATRIKPDYQEAFYNWGDALDEQAQVEPELSTQRKLWNDAYAKFAEATRIKPDDHEAFYIWGLALGQQARVEPDLSTKQKLWNDACAKYAEAARIKPDYEDAFCNWASTLIELGHASADAKEKARYWQDALTKTEAALAISPDTSWFNNACAHSLLGNTEMALTGLQNWRTNTPSAAKPEVRDERDFDPIRNDPAFVEFYNSLPDKPPST